MAEVRLEVELAHPPERVWRALTEARLLGEWFMPTDLAPREGGRFTLTPGDLAGFAGQLSGQLTELSPPHRMVMVWQGEQLHTRVSWEVAAVPGGSRLRVRQTGFIGAPGAVRRRALQETYARLFTRQLPALLDRIAITGPAGADGAAGSGGRPGAGRVEPARLRAAVPRQRRPGINEPGIWATGRGLAPAPGSGSGSGEREPLAPSVRAAGRDAPLPGRSGPGQVGGVPRPRQAVEALPDGGLGDEPAAAPGASPATGPRAGRGPGSVLWEVVPGWLRAAAIGGAAAVLAVVVLAVASYPPGPDRPVEDLPGEPAGPRGPGVALQPGAGTSQTGLVRAPGAGQPASGPDRGATAAAGAPLAGAPAAAPDAAVPPENTAADPVPPAPVLTAQLTTSGLPLVGGRTVAVSVANPGPGPAEWWEVTMDVGDQTVSEVAGAGYARDGSVATFTPQAAGGLAAGDSTGFSFDLTAPTLGLLGASDPTDCMIDGRPCD
jgi:uncharacterized protein YndB with AHSA1/START domain